MRFKRFEIALICAILAAFLAGFVRDCDKEAQALSDKLIRLHVVANSDSEDDQALKLAVRDAVLEEVRTRLKGVTGVSEAHRILVGSLSDLSAAGSRVVSQWGADYTVSASLKRENFPTVDYDTFSLPAGSYESLRVEIGKAEGHNWWCVVFPPVCDRPFIDQDAAATLGLTGEEVGLITRSDGRYAVRFKVVEWWNEFWRLFK